MAILGLSSLFFLGHLLRGIFAKTKIPDLLIITLLGYIIGPVLGVVSPEDFGRLGAVLSTVALIVILYEGGLHLKATSLVSSSWPTLKITMTAFIFGIVAITMLAMALGFQSPTTALLLGLCLSSTSSAVVIPLVRTLSISDSFKTILSLESAITDVLTIVLFLVAVEGISSGEVEFKNIMVSIGPKTLLAMVVGCVFAFIWVFIKTKLAAFLPKAFAGEAFALLVYGVSDVWGVNGALSVLAFGFTLGNLNLFPLKDAEALSEKLTTEQDLTLLGEISNLLRTFFFLYLGILIQLSSVTTVLLAVILTAAIFLTRYLAVNLMFSAKNINRLEAMTVTVMGPRGLAAAVLATIPLQKGIDGGGWIQEISFAVVLVTIIATAFSVILIEIPATRRLLSKFFIKFPDGSTQIPPV